MRLRNLIPVSAKLVLFKTAILPYLTYCQLVWHFCNASESCKIERLQDRGLRAVYIDHHATYSEILQSAELPRLKNTRLQDVYTLVFKVKHKFCPAYINTHSTSYFLRQIDFSVPRYIENNTWARGDMESSSFYVFIFSMI